MELDENAAFVVGVAIGDGNISNPNGKAVRLRISCDTVYPDIICEIECALRKLLPQNKVSRIERKDNCVDISVYSNKLIELLPWKVGLGTKHEQKAHVPLWIRNRPTHCIACLRGLIMTDGSIYLDRGYKMVNFCNNIQPLASDVGTMIESLGFKPRLSITSQPSGKHKYTIRVAQDIEKFLDTIGLFIKS